MSNGSSGLFRLIVSFTNTNGSPLSDGSWSVKVRDKDPLFDGNLGEAKLDVNGSAGIFISVADISSIDSPGERTPDIYFILYQNGNKMLTTDVVKNVDFEIADPVTGRATGSMTKEFGPYVVAN